jgi:hypothetical protein
VPRFVTRFLVALSMVAISSPASAELITISDTQPMLDYPLCACNATLPAAFPFALFDFTGQPRLANLQSMQITLTLEDGDNARGEFDFNRLTLGLDNISTGLRLNGFRSGQEVTLTFDSAAGTGSWIGQSAANAILNSLYGDGMNQLLGNILDSTPDDNAVNTYSVNNTTLRLTGDRFSPVPEPASLLVWAAAAGSWMCFRRRRDTHACGSALS